MPTCSLLFWSWSVSIKLRGWLQTLLRKFHKTNFYENNNTNPCPKENICSYLRISIDFQQMQEINFWTCKLISYYLFKNHTSTPLLLLHPSYPFPRHSQVMASVQASHCRTILFYFIFTTEEKITTSSPYKSNVITFSRRKHKECN